MKYLSSSVLSSYPLVVSLLSMNLQHYRERIAVHASVSLLLIFGTTSASVAQVIGNGPAFSNFQPSTINPSNGYSLDTGVTCPTPSFSVVGFGGNASDYVRPAILDYSSNSGLDSYGIAAGISVPLGGQLANFCRDFAELRTKDLLKRIEIIESKFQSQLIQQCYYLYTLHINFEEPYYNENGPGSALFPCRAIVKTIQPPQVSTQQPPNTSSQQPPPTQQPPNTSSQQPPPTQQPPNTSSQQPPKVSTQQPPNTSSQQPPPTQQPPNTSSQQPPKVSTQQPPNTSSQQPPKVSTQQPPNTSSQQPPSTQNPENIITEPESLTPRPIITYPVR